MEKASKASEGVRLWDELGHVCRLRECSPVKAGGARFDA